jgi:hypothetical protein
MRYVLVTIILFFVAGTTHANLIFDLTYSSTGSSASKTGAVGNALGTFELNKMAGELFTVHDLVALDITVKTTNTTTQKYFTPKLSDRLPNEQNNLIREQIIGIIFEGKISENGLTVSFTDIFLKNGVTQFGCNMFDCNSGGVIQVVGSDTSGDTTLSDLFNYDNQEDIRNSFKVALKKNPYVAVSEPATIVFIALGMMGLILRRLKQSPQKH